jgi:hypothetical protein
LVGFCIYRICQECELNNSKIVIILSDLNGVVLGSKRKIPRPKNENFTYQNKIIEDKYNLIKSYSGYDLI